DRLVSIDPVDVLTRVEGCPCWSVGFERDDEVGPWREQTTPAAPDPCPVLRFVEREGQYWTLIDDKSPARQPVPCPAQVGEPGVDGLIGKGQRATGCRLGRQAGEVRQDPLLGGEMVDPAAWHLAPAGLLELLHDWQLGRGVVPDEANHKP